MQLTIVCCRCSGFQSPINSPNRTVRENPLTQPLSGDIYVRVAKGLFVTNDEGKLSMCCMRNH